MVIIFFEAAAAAAALLLSPFICGDFGDLQSSLPFSEELPFGDAVPLFLPSFGDFGRVVGIYIYIYISNK